MANTINNVGIGQNIAGITVNQLQTQQHSKSNDRASTPQGVQNALLQSTASNKWHSICQCQLWIYIAHKRKASNVLTMLMHMHTFHALLSKYMPSCNSKTVKQSIDFPWFISFPDFHASGHAVDDNRTAKCQCQCRTLLNKKFSGECVGLCEEMGLQPISELFTTVSK